MTETGYEASQLLQELWFSRGWKGLQIINRQVISTIKSVPNISKW